FAILLYCKYFPTRRSSDLALRRVFAERGITTAKLGGFDVDGIFRGKYVSLEKFFSAAEKDLGFCDVIFGWDSGDALLDNTRLTRSEEHTSELQSREKLVCR